MLLGGISLCREDKVVQCNERIHKLESDYQDLLSQ